MLLKGAFQKQVISTCFSKNKTHLNDGKTIELEPEELGPRPGSVTFNSQNLLRVSCVPNIVQNALCGLTDIILTIT